MGQKRASVLLRLTAMLVLILSMSATARIARAQDAGNGGDATAYADGGDVVSTTVISISADGGTATADASGGDFNDVTVSATATDAITEDDGAVIDGGEFSVGNGGRATADASGGDVIVGDVVSGGNSGNDVLIGNTVGGANGGGDANVDVFGGTATFVTEINASANGGTATANAFGGSDNDLTVTAAGVYSAAISGGTFAVGNGGIAAADASGGFIEVGDVFSGDNVGNIITVGDTIGGTGDCDCAPVDPAVIIDGGNVVATTILNLSADGGTATANAYGGSNNDLDVTATGVYGAAIYGGDFAVGNGGDAAAFAAGGDIEVGDIYSGENTGNIITVGDTLGGNGCCAGEALVDIVGGDVISLTELNISANGGDAEAWAIGGSDNDVDVTATSAYGAAIYDASVSVGNGGIATAAADGGSVLVGDIYSGGNVGNDILVGDTVAGDGGHCGCEGGDATVLIDGGLVVSATYLDITADGGTAYASASGGDFNDVDITATGVYGATIGVDDTSDDDVEGDDGPFVSVGNGGVAGAYANGGAVEVGAIYSGDNLGHVITVGLTVGGHGDDGGGDATVAVFGGDVVSVTEGSITASGGVATAYADGGDFNVVTVDATSIYGAAIDNGTVDVGNGGDSFSDASGGLVSLGDIVSGGNTGNVITIGDTCGGGAVDCPTPEPVDECDDDCDCDSDCDGCDDCHCDKCDGKDHDGKKVVVVTTTAKGSTAVSALPNTGAGEVQGQSGTTSLLLLTTVLALAGVGFGLRKRLV
jgi:hypothetical protein